jgi:hypothetical protein
MMYLFIYKMSRNIKFLLLPGLLFYGFQAMYGDNLSVSQIAPDAYYRFHKGDAIIAQLPGREVDSISVAGGYIHVYAGHARSHRFYAGVIDSVTFSGTPALLPRQATDMKIAAAGHTFSWDAAPAHAMYTELEYVRASGARETLRVENQVPATTIAEDIRHGLAYFRVRTAYDTGSSEWMHIHLPLEITPAGPAVSSHANPYTPMSRFNDRRLLEKRPNVYEGDMSLNAGDLRLFARPNSWSAGVFCRVDAAGFSPGTAYPFLLHPDVSGDPVRDWTIAASADAAGIYRVTVDMNEATVSATKIGRHITHINIRDMENVDGNPSASSIIRWAGAAPPSLLYTQLEYVKATGEKQTRIVLNTDTLLSLQDVKPGFACVGYRAVWSENGDMKYSDQIRFNPSYTLRPVGPAVNNGWTMDADRIAEAAVSPNVYDFNLTTIRAGGGIRFTTGDGWYFPSLHLRPAVNSADVTTDAGMNLFYRYSAADTDDNSWKASETGTYHFHIDLNEWTFSAEKINAAPAVETPSALYALTVDGNPVPVYNARVAPADDNSRWAAMGDILNSHLYFEMAAFATFDMEQPAAVTVTLPRQVHSVKVLPASAGIVPAIAGNTFSFQLATPQKLTFEVNGEWVSALHVFANPPETDMPDISDPAVVYFGPGIHEITTLKIHDNQTLYLAEGAILKGKLREGESYRIESVGGAKYYFAHTAIELAGDNIRVCGRGIIDMEDCTTHSRRTMEARSCKNLTVEGVIFRNAAEWNLALHDCDGVDVHNIKILGYRANSDGIDICSSRGVTVDDCFIRTLDDLVVVKTEKIYPSQSRNITVRNCILWNEVAHALSLGAEITAGMDSILFTGCDVIHDKGREWTLRVYHCDKAAVSNVRFENIRVEESKKLISLWIGESSWWSSDPERGHIDDVTFKDIIAQGAPLTVELKGYDATHKVRNVSLENVRLNGAPLTLQQVSQNAFVEGVVVKN